MALHAFRPRMTSRIRDFALLSPLSWRHLSEPLKAPSVRDQWRKRL